MNGRQWLVHPLTAGLDPTDPENFPFYEQIIRRKKFLRRLYREWYDLLLTALPSGEEPVVELGSGAGFLRDFLPEAITSDIIPNPLVRMVLDGQALPFQKGSLRAVVMVNVLHHIPRPRFLLSEAGRCCRRGGALVLLEPWNTPWSRLVYNRWHHEPFDPEASDWELPPRRPLSAANQAMAWILFHRDRLQLNREFPEWEIEEILPLMPFRYLFSGGLTWRALAPAWSFGLLRSLERGLHPWINSLAMFARIVLRRTGHIT